MLVLLLILTLIFGKQFLPEWLQVRVAVVEGHVLALLDPIRGMFGGPS